MTENTATPDPVVTALQVARAAVTAAQEVAVAADGAGTALVATGPDAALAVKAQMAAAHAEVAKVRRQALEQVANAREAVKAQQEALEAQLRAMDAQLEPLTKQLSRMKEGIWSISLYTGRDEEIVTLREGKPAPAATPIYVRQQVLAMDEECAFAAESGGMDFRDVEQFDAWLLASPANLDQLLPEPRGVVAVMARRQDRDYGDPWANKTLNAENHRTWWLFRNGEQLYRMTTNFQVGSRLVPAADEFTRMFLDHWTHQPLQPGTRQWVEAEEVADAHQHHYMRVALVLQGVIDRTHILAPLPKAGLNLLAMADYDAGYIVQIADDEKQLTTGRKPFAQWLSELNSQLMPGMRVMVTTAHHKWPRSRDGEPTRVYPSTAQAPATGQVYVLARKGPSSGSFVFTYPRTDKIWVRDRWGRDDLRVPKTSASCTINVTDPFVVPIDLVDVTTMRQYMQARTERHAYANMFPLLRAAVAFKEAEAAAEAPFRDLLAARVAAAENVDLEVAHQLIDPVIATWKVGARWFRPLQGDPQAEARAAKAILAERARISAANTGVAAGADDRFVARALREHSDALLVARKKDGTYVVLTPTPRRWTTVDARWGDKVAALNVWVTRHEYTKAGRLKSSQPWWLPAPATVSRWIVLHEGPAWGTWDKSARASEHLTDPEILAVIEDLRRDEVPGHQLMVICYEEDPLRSGYTSHPMRFTAWYHPGPVTIPDRLLTGQLAYVAAHQRTTVTTRERDGSITLRRGQVSDGSYDTWSVRHNFLIDSTKTSPVQAPWEGDRRAHLVAWTDDLALAQARAHAQAREDARVQQAKLAQTVSALWAGVVKDWTARALAVARDRFMEDYADEDLWAEHARHVKLTFPYEHGRQSSEAGAVVRWAIRRLVEVGQVPVGLSVQQVLDLVPEHAEKLSDPIPDDLACLHLAGKA